MRSLKRFRKTKSGQKPAEDTPPKSHKKRSDTVIENDIKDIVVENHLDVNHISDEVEEKNKLNRVETTDDVFESGVLQPNNSVSPHRHVGSLPVNGNSANHSADTELQNRNDSNPKSNGGTLVELDSNVSNCDKSVNNSHISTAAAAKTPPNSPHPAAARVTSPFQNLGRTTPSIEGMQQLSRQINGLLSQSSSYLNGGDDVEPDLDNSLAELETRNKDLAAQLEKHNQTNHQLSFSCEELTGQNVKLQEQMMKERQRFEEQLRKEIGALKEQLQVHIQTIGILVAEKSELQSSLSQSQKSAQQRLDELEVLSGRLKASRQRVADLEKTSTTSNQSSKKFEKNSKELSKEVDRLKIEIYKVSKSSEDLRQQNSELQEKLNGKVSECANLNQTVKDVKHELGMKDVLLQQLSNQSANSNESAQMVQLLNAEKVELTNRLENYNEAFQKLTAERDQIAVQYQQYIEQLKQRETQLQEQVESLIEERDRMQKRHEELDDIISRLNYELANQNPSAGEDLQTLVQELSGQLQKVKLDYEELTAKYQAQVRDNSQLSRFVDEREVRIQELESTVEKLSENSVDHNQLLENLQSDKMALSRAMTQNKELKTQLAELQNGFMKMSHENMDLLTQLQNEQHVSKELGTRLGQQEDELKEIREQVVTKETQLRHLHEEQTLHNKQMFQAEQLEDRIRHFEAQGQLVDTLQRELNSAQDTINALTSQNTELKNLLRQASEVDQSENASDTDAKQAEMVHALSASVRQLEMERNEVLNQCREETRIRQSLQEEIIRLQKENELQAPSMLNGTYVTKEQFDAMQAAMKMLEDKYTSVMRDKADLDDQRDQYEHIILQLQTETDTIGDYISLYHQQRGVLQHREQEKEEYIVRLTREREDMQSKLGELQALVMKLLQERNQLNSSYNNGGAILDNQTLSLSAVANHDNIANNIHDKSFGKTLDSSQLDDWPDYTSSGTGSDSDVSEVEAIIATRGEPISVGTNIETDSSDHHRHHPSQHHHHHHHQEQLTKNTVTTTTIPQDNTASKIMHLITEIGNKTNSSLELESSHIVPCKCCHGRLQVV
ncbi:golgin subfamily A member 2-like [Tubulanus polymorphus]|uniref:golgin subfamily A member 2-like n=1 Tax=Tubulanus polymorphus TaxID=672921 RepID=UPI003DA53B54